MSANTEISWADHTFNPWWGCARVSPGCLNCYAERDAARFAAGHWRKSGPRRFFGDRHWAEPLAWNRKAEKAGVPAKVFCASMADVFEDHPAVGSARERLWGLIRETPWLRWMLLTKRPENVAGMVPWGDSWPGTVWLGTSVEDQERADERIPELVKHAASVLFLSCEPALGPVDLSRWLWDGGSYRTDYGTGVEYDQWVDPQIDWCIAGGESGPKARPAHPGWFRSLRGQCAETGVAFHFKQFGEFTPYVPMVADSSRPNGLGPDWDREPTVWVERETGRTVPDEPDVPATGSWHAVYRVGKKAAGRTLDGREWLEFPREAASHA